MFFAAAAFENFDEVDGSCGAQDFVPHRAHIDEELGGRHGCDTVYACVDGFSRQQFAQRLLSR
ncbi:hypothetical protein A5653_17670 [Mycobacterium colombiense]|nr:hypothetical protein A5653_17670 [Mycobacterium colombiense]